MLQRCSETPQRTQSTPVFRIVCMQLAHIKRLKMLIHSYETTMLGNRFEIVFGGEKKNFLESWRSLAY